MVNWARCRAGDCRTFCFLPLPLTQLHLCLFAAESGQLQAPASGDLPPGSGLWSSTPHWLAPDRLALTHGERLGRSEGYGGALSSVNTSWGAPGRCAWCCPARVLSASFVLVPQGASLCRNSFPAVKPCMGKGVWMTHTVPFSHGWLSPLPSETSLQLGYSLLPTSCC